LRYHDLTGPKPFRLLAPISPGCPEAVSPGIGPSGLLINFGMQNSSDKIISSVIRNYRFETTDHLSTAHEEDNIMSNITDGIDTPNEGGMEINPHTSGGWFTVQDKKISANDWQNAISGILILRVCRVHVTESCMIIGKGFPATHYCIGHNRSFTYTSHIRN
jgi:hypothetical protein